jgi:hypothetical protein
MGLATTSVPLLRLGIQKRTPRKARRSDDGAGEEIRTPDPRITNALLYQLSYSGEGAQYKD